MEKITDKKRMNMLAFLFASVYMISYVTRINYGAVISEMAAVENLSKSLLSMALTGSFITYGAGQVISGIFGDRFSPKKLITYGFILTTAMNLLIPLCANPYQMTAVWCVNGFAQAFMWPPLVKIMTTVFTEEGYKEVSVKVSWGSSFGTIIVYLASPLMIALSGWRSVFFVSAVCGLAMIFIWNKFCVDTGKGGNVKDEPPEKTKGNIKMLFSPVVLGIMLAIILQGMLRDGVTTWMPSYISETYKLSNVISILTGVVLPVFSIVCFHVSSKLYQKKFRNPLTCAGVIFGTGAAAALVLFALSGANAAFSVLFSALLTGCMHGVNLILICMIPPYFRKLGMVSTASGVLNSCTYIGSAISTYGIAVISENAGWSTTLFIWFIIAALGTASCFVCARPWRKFSS